MIKSAIGGLLIARKIDRLNRNFEELIRLYRLDLESRDIITTPLKDRKPTPDDMTEIFYTDGSKQVDMDAVKAPVSREDEIDQIRKTLWE